MKILRVIANNFKLCENDFTISFIPTGNKSVDDKEFELHEIDDGLFVFKTMAIIGKNASGKTTAVDLLSLVYDIFSNFRIKSSMNIFKYWNKRISIDVVFYHDKHLYRYTTELEKDENSVDDNIVLFYNQKLYERVYKKSHSKSLFDFDKYSECNNNVDLPKDTSIIYNLLKSIQFRGIYCPSEDYIYENYSNSFNIYKLLDNNYKIVESILKMFDEHLERISMINEDKYLITYANKVSKEVSNRELYEILSSGTTKGLGLYTFIVYSLKYGCDLVIDEIENHFHKKLVENILSLYKDKSVNKNNASLIFTTHYCELLDLFNRKDNIYITKYKNNIFLENMGDKYNFRPELSKSNKFYSNAFDTDVDYESLMKFKKDLMQ